MFESYKAWCEDALKKTDDAVKAGKDEIKELEELMIELTARIAKLKVQIAAAQKAYKKESSALAEFRTMSDEKYKTLAADIKELAQMVKYLEDAITVLQGAQQSR